MFGIFYYSHLHVQGPTVLLFKQKKKIYSVKKTNLTQTYYKPFIIWTNIQRALFPNTSYI